MKCNEAKTILSEYIDGILDKQKAGHLKGHLLKCKSCKEAFFILKSVIRELAALKPVKAPDNFLHTLFERMEISSLLDVLDEGKQPLPREKTENSVAEIKPGHEDISERIEELLKIGEEEFEEKKDSETDTVLKPDTGGHPEKENLPDPGPDAVLKTETSDTGKPAGTGKVPSENADIQKTSEGSSDEWDLNEFKTMEFSATNVYNVLDEVLGPDEEPLPEKPVKKSDPPIPDTKSHEERPENEAEQKEADVPSEPDKEQDDDEAMKLTYVFDMGIPAGEFDDPDTSEGSSSEKLSQEADTDNKKETGNRIRKLLLLIAALTLAGGAVYGIYTLRDTETFQNLLRSLPFVGEK